MRKRKHKRHVGIKQPNVTVVEKRRENENEVILSEKKKKKLRIHQN